MKEITVSGFGGLTQVIQVADDDPRVTVADPAHMVSSTENVPDKPKENK